MTVRIKDVVSFTRDSQRNSGMLQRTKHSQTQANTLKEKHMHYFMPNRASYLFWVLCFLVSLCVGCAEKHETNSASDASENMVGDSAVNEGRTESTSDTSIPSTPDATRGESTQDMGFTELDATSRLQDGTVVSADMDTTSPEDAEIEMVPPRASPDLNEDGVLNILVIGTSQSIEDGGEAFSPVQIADALSRILTDDPEHELDINVVAQDIYQTEVLTTGYGQGGSDYDWPYFCHSLAQYYFWPTDRDARITNLLGEGEHDWDQVVIAGDPHIIKSMPGYHALGVNRIAAKVSEGGAQPLLLMTWMRDADTADHFAELTRRTSLGASTPIPVIPAGVAWLNLSADQQDTARVHPTPNGAYVSAAAIYAHLYGRSASTSNYTGDDDIADSAMTAVMNEDSTTYAYETNAFRSPFTHGEISDRILNYNHTGTSSERGILRGLRWVLAQANVRLDNGGQAPIHFNYGRANTEFEAHKRYRIAPAEFQFSLGFPMQDNSNHGNTTMLYGLDKRRGNIENGTDLGVARKMIRDGELPHARAVPIRTLFAQMKESIPQLSAYADGWHMNHDLDKATGAFMYTMLTGHCALNAEPADRDSGAWRAWVAHKAGYETAWQFMHLSARAPCFKVHPGSVDSVSVSPSETSQLMVSFVNAPTQEVTVTVSTDAGEMVRADPTQLTFTPENYNTPQMVVLSAQGDAITEGVFTVTTSTQSSDSAFDSLSDRWTYTLAP